MKASEFTFTPYRSTAVALLLSRAQHSALDRSDPSRGGLLLGEARYIGVQYEWFIPSLSPMARSSHRVKRCVSASVSKIATPPCTDDVEFNFPSTVTVMKADSAIHLDPWCIVDARNAFDRLIREPTGGRGRRTAEELCVF